MHGGQSVPHFDYAMAEGVIKTYAKEQRSVFCACLRIAGVGRGRRGGTGRETAVGVRPSMAEPMLWAAR